jgi:transposase
MIFQRAIIPSVITKHPHQSAEKGLFATSSRTVAQSFTVSIQDQRIAATAHQNLPWK